MGMGPPLAVVSGADSRLEVAQRRAVPVLVLSQALGGVGQSSGIAVGGLLAQKLSGSTSLAGLSQTATVLGAAVLAVPLARLAQRAGRRPALATGYLLALLGAGVVLLAALLSSFAMLLLGAALFGGATAASLQARYAATDAAAPQARGRALSIVVWATTIGVVAGPNLSGVGGRLGIRVGVPVLAGPYLLSALGFAAAAAVLAWLRPDPLRLRQQVSAESTAGAPVAGSLRDSLAAVAAHPRALLGFVTIATAHAVMVGVMVMTPVYLVHGGASLQVVGIVISLHVAGMYGASPVFGWMSDRVGRTPTILLGVALLATSLALAGTAGAGHRQSGLALLLLGLGWSACLVAGSTLVTESVSADVRTSVQGMTDLGMGLAGAAAGAAAGVVMSIYGYPGLALAAAALLLPVPVLAARAGARRE